MNLKPIRKYRRHLEMTSGIVQNNPVLGLGLALPFVVIASTSLKRGVVMSLVMLVATVPPVIAAHYLNRRLPRWLRLPVYGLISITAIVLLRLYLVRFPVIMEDLGVYVPLAAVNMMMVEVATRAGKQSLHDAVREALSYSIGFALVMCGLSAVREIMSLHTIWDIPLRLPAVTISGAGLPCFGFILLGFFAAFGRALNRARIRMMLRRSAETPVGREESV